MRPTNPWNFCYFLLTVFLAAAAIPAVAQDTTTDEETEQVDVQDMMREAVQHMQSGEFEDAAMTLEKVIKADEKNVSAMVMAAQAYMGWGVEMAQDDRKAANKPLRRGCELMRIVQKQKPTLTNQEKQTLAISIYNEACCAAVDGDADNAIKFLKEALDAGFNDLDTLEHDSDFDSVKNDDRFKALVKQLSEDEDGEMEDEDV